jgi:hypothetical protein
MGYTHYWDREVELDAKQFALAVADCRKICERLNIPLGDWNGKGEPEFSQECVSFNGHVDSGSFARQGGLVWPAKRAESVAIAGDDVRVGGWCAGPTVSARCVDENGDGSYETFVVGRVEGHPFFPTLANDLPLRAAAPSSLCFAFCKTNYRPYDLCVQCCLIVFAEHLGSAFNVSSDGDDAAWNEARDACQVVLGYGLDFELPKGR